jgi:uncharacterized protein YkwD
MISRKRPWSEWLARAALAMIALLLGSTGAAAQSPQELRSFALELVNEARASQGLPALSFEAELNEAAKAHAEDMLRRGYFAHVSPEGGTAMDRYRAAGGSTGRLVAENIAQCAGCAPEREAIARLHRGWMKSPGHRANILSPGVARFGFGIAAEGGRMTAVQTFAGPGEPVGTTRGSDSRVLDAPGQLAAFLELVNAARAESGIGPLQPSPELAEALRRAATAQEFGEGDLSLPPIEQVLSSLPGSDRERIRSATVLAGQCGGCGVEPTAADIRFFAERWLKDAKYREVLLDPDWSELGAIVEADGEGRKRALAILLES